MSNKLFSDFYYELLELIKEYEKKSLMLRVEQNLESNMIRLFGENSDTISRAKISLGDVEELAYTTAEHHPYWALLYHCMQIGKTSLEKWNDELSKDEIEEIEWSINELKNTCKKLKENLS